MPSTLNCSSRRRQSTWNTARLATRCSSFCGHRKISSDSSQMRHRSRTGSRAGKRNTPKVDFASAFGVFLFVRGWKRSAGTRSLHPADAVWKGFGKLPTSIFARGRKDTEQKWQIGTSLHCLHTLCSRCSLCIIEELFAADTVGTELIGFAHSRCRGYHPCSCRRPAASQQRNPVRFSALPRWLSRQRWLSWLPIWRWLSQPP